MGVISVDSRASVDSPWPFFSTEESEAAQRILASGKVNYWTGTEGREFEREFAAYIGTKHAVVMMNGTVTLDASLRAIDLQPGDEVIVPPRTFMATASSVVMEGGTPIFADVDPISGNISAETIAPHITKKTKAVIPVHLAGWPVEMDSIMALAAEHGLCVIEDCAQAHGATYKGKKVGSIGHMASWSFCQDKIISTAGEGGMLTTNDQSLWSTVWSLKDHGKSYDAVYNRKHPIGFRWLHEHFGSNWRMPEIQSAVGRIQLRKLDGWKAKRTENAAILTQVLSEVPSLRVEQVPAHMEHAYYKFYAYLRPEALKADWPRQRILEAISSRGVPAFSGSCSEVYLERAFADSGLAPKTRLPVAKELGETSIMFQVHPTLTKAEVEYTAEVVANAVRQATR